MDHRHIQMKPDIELLLMQRKPQWGTMAQKGIDIKPKTDDSKGPSHGYEGARRLDDLEAGSRTGSPVITESGDDTLRLAPWQKRQREALHDDGTTPYEGQEEQAEPKRGTYNPKPGSIQCSQQLRLQPYPTGDQHQRQPGRMHPPAKAELGGHVGLLEPWSQIKKSRNP